MFIDRLTPLWNLKLLFQLLYLLLEYVSLMLSVNCLLLKVNKQCGYTI